MKRVTVSERDVLYPVGDDRSYVMLNGQVFRVLLAEGMTLTVRPVHRCDLLEALRWLAEDWAWRWRKRRAVGRGATHG